MNDRSGLLTLAAYTTATMLIAVVALLGIFRLGAVERVRSIQPVAEDPPPQVAAAGTRALRPPGQTSGGLSRAEQRVQLLEAMLADKSQLLRRQAQQISRHSGELTDLRQQYDNALLVIEGLKPELTTQPAPAATDGGEAAAAAAAPDQDSDASPARSLEDEIADLQAELDLAHAVHDALVEDLDALQAELEQAYVRMGQLRVESDVTSANELRDALAMEAAAANILLGLGNSAVSPLMDALSHENPIVRRWAASVLGGMGSAAEEAVPALTEMLMDSDVDVQRAAQAALDAIER